MWKHFGNIIKRHTVRVRCHGPRCCVATDLGSLVFLAVAGTELKHLLCLRQLLSPALLLVAFSPHLSCVWITWPGRVAPQQMTSLLTEEPASPETCGSWELSCPPQPTIRPKSVWFHSKCRYCSWLPFFFLVPINRALPTVTSHPSPWRWSLLLGRKTQSENSQQDGLLGVSPERQWAEASGGRSLVNREPAPQRLEGKKRWFKTPFWASTLCSATLDSFCSWKPDSQNFYA